MAWTEISNTAVAVGGTPTSATVTALRDNPLAIAEGASNAPRIAGDAAAREGNGLPVVAISAADTVKLERGFTEDSGTYTITSYTGTIRFRQTLTYTGGEQGSAATLRVFLNGSEVGFASKGSAGSATTVDDISIAPGDEMTFTVTGPGTAGDIRYYANDGYVNMPLAILASNI